MSDGDDSKKITFKYKFADDYNPRYVNGAYGGVGPQGELIINFYMERQPIPKQESYKLQKAGQLGDPISRVPDDLKSQVIRFVQTGIVLNLESAKRVLGWLKGHVERLERMKGQESG